VPDLTLETDDLLHQFARNQADLDAITAGAMGGRVAEEAGVGVVDTRTDLPYFNQATMLRPLDGIDDPALDRVDAFWAGEARPNMLLSVWPTPDLTARGWQLMGHPMLVARPPGPHPPAERDGVTIRDVTTADDLAAVERTVIEGYPIEGWAAPIGTLLPAALLDTGMRFRLGVVDGVVPPATRGYVGGRVVPPALAATLPAARRRGVWAAMVWARVDDGADLPAMAYTSDHSRPGFLRMGFLPVAHTCLWFRAPG
jgi:hypothetical protein